MLVIFSGQADELGARFDKIHLDHIFVSPFDRTLETATRLLRGHKDAVIKVEPGLAEVSLFFLISADFSYNSIWIYHL